MPVWLLAADEDASQGGLPQLMFMMIAMFAILYFLVFRPQRKREQERKAMIRAIGKNDKVVTTGGIIGIVTNVKDDEITIRIDDDKNVRIRVRRDFITGVLNRDGSSKTD